MIQSSDLFTERVHVLNEMILSRWRSADGNDYLCGQCQNQNEVSVKPSSPAKFGGRSFGKPAVSESWRSAVKNNIGEVYSINTNSDNNILDFDDVFSL